MHGFGWLRDPPDYRDYRYGPPTATLKAGLPDSVDLRPSMPKVFDQGPIGSCTANAANAVVQYVEKHDRDPDADRLSRLWTYWFSREKIGTTGSDSGAFTRDAFKVLAERGAPRERYWPYNVSQLMVKPTAGSVSALHHQLLEYRRVNELSEHDMRACLAEGYPFVFGFAVYDSFMRVGADGQWMPAANEPIVGYHAVVCVGYRPSEWIVRNSWGASWGNAGHFFVPRNFMVAEAFDCWTARKVSVDPV